jgi:subtilisin family serine protease
VSALDLVRLGTLMAQTSGSAGVAIALLDGPVAMRHPDLAAARICALGAAAPAACATPHSAACAHGTFVAGILVARRGSAAPAICPGCTLLVRPIFRELHGGAIPHASPEQLAAAILESVAAGARIVNLSVATGAPSMAAERPLHEALGYAARRGVLVVAAAGNDGTLGSSAITRHPAVIPVVAVDRGGRPTGGSNLGSSIGRRGVGAPGGGIASLHPTGTTRIRGGTSAAAAFVTGALALLWSRFPHAEAAELRSAVTGTGRRRAVMPPVLDAQAAMQRLSGGG